MIDKVTLRIYNNPQTEQIFSKILESMTDTKTTTDEDGQVEYQRGHLNNLSVSVSSKCICLTGSLTRYLSGSNFNTMRRPDLLESITHLCNDIGGRKEDINVSSIEIGDTFVMEQEPLRYINQLTETGYLPRFYKERYKGSLYFKQKAGQREIIFYDKAAEMMSRREPVPPGLHNLLRYELRLHYQAIKKHLPTRTLADLTDGQIYKALVSQWREYYEALFRTAKPIPTGRGRIEILLKYICQLQKRCNTDAADLLNYLNETMRGTANATRLKRRVAAFYAVQGQEDNGLLRELRDRVTESVLE